MTHCTCRRRILASVTFAQIARVQFSMRILEAVIGASLAPVMMAGSNGACDHSRRFRIDLMKYAIALLVCGLATISAHADDNGTTRSTDTPRDTRFHGH
jgi:hypothetical protein